MSRRGDDSQVAAVRPETPLKDVAALMVSRDQRVPVGDTVPSWAWSPRRLRDQERDRAVHHRLLARVFGSPARRARSSQDRAQTPARDDEPDHRPGDDTLRLGRQQMRTGSQPPAVVEGAVRRDHHARCRPRLRAPRPGLARLVPRRSCTTRSGSSRSVRRPTSRRVVTLGPVERRSCGDDRRRDPGSRRRRRCSRRSLSWESPTSRTPGRRGDSPRLTCARTEPTAAAPRHPQGAGWGRRGADESPGVGLPSAEPSRTATGVRRRRLRGGLRGWSGSGGRHEIPASRGPWPAARHPVRDRGMVPGAGKSEREAGCPRCPAAGWSAHVEARANERYVTTAR